MNRGITKENLLLIVPPALTNDTSIMALSEVGAEALAARLAEIDRVRVISNIDGLEEAVLDILAYDFKVDWWDPEYTLEEKRQTLKDSWRVHKLLGTKAAVVRAISAIYPRTQVLEWFEYGGEPYHFRLDINITNDSIDSDKQRRVLQRLNYYKSLRSHNDGVTYFVEAEPAIAKAGGGVPGLWEAVHVPLELPVPLIKPTASARVGATTGLWESVTARVELPTPVIRPTATARVGATAGLCEAFTARLDLSAPAIRGLASVRLGASVGLQEAFTAGIVLPDGTPARSEAQLRTAAVSTWQERYMTKAIPLMDKVLTATAQAHAKGAVTSTQETAKTHINLQEVDYGGTE